MKLIPLSAGRGFAMVDDCDYERASAHKWRLARGYAMTGGGRLRGQKTECIPLHRFILSPEPGQQLDHINRNRLDNRRSNLRVATGSQNQANTLSRTGKKYKGTTFHKASGKFQACIMHGNRNCYLGLFASEIDAARAYDAKAIELHGEFAYLNFPKESRELGIEGNGVL